MKVDGCITRRLFSWAPHDASFQGDSLKAGLNKHALCLFPWCSHLLSDDTVDFEEPPEGQWLKWKKKRASAARTQAQSWKINTLCFLDMPWNLLCYTAGDIFMDNLLLFRNNPRVTDHCGLAAAMLCNLYLSQTFYNVCCIFLAMLTTWLYTFLLYQLDSPTF